MNLSTSLTRPSKSSNNKNNKACSRRAEHIPARQLDQIASCTLGGSRKDGSWQIHKLSILRTKLVNVSKGMSFLQLFRNTHKHSLNINANSALTSTLARTHKHQRPTDTQTHKCRPHKSTHAETCIPSIWTQNLHFCTHKHTTKTTYAPHLEVNVPGGFSTDLGLTSEALQNSVRGVSWVGEGQSLHRLSQRSFWTESFT